MNWKCKGHFFSLKERDKTYYRCLWQGEIVGDVEQGGICTECNRTIDGKDCGVVEATMITQVAIPFFEDGRDYPYIKCLIPEDSE